MLLLLFLTLTDPRRGVLTLTNPWGGNFFLENWQFNGRSLYIDWRMIVVGDVLHHVKRDGKMSGGICPGKYVQGNIRIPEPQYHVKCSNSSFSYKHTWTLLLHSSPTLRKDWATILHLILHHMRQTKLCYHLNHAIFVKFYHLYTQFPVTFAHIIGESRLFSVYCDFLIIALYRYSYLLTYCGVSCG